MPTEYKDSKLGKLTVSDNASHLSLRLSFNRYNDIGGHNSINIDMFNGGENQLWLNTYDKNNKLLDTHLLGDVHFTDAKAEKIKSIVSNALASGLNQQKVDEIANAMVATVNDERLQSLSFSNGYIAKPETSVKAKDGSADVSIFTGGGDNLSIEITEKERKIKVVLTQGDNHIAYTKDSQFTAIEHNMHDRLDASERKQIRDLAGVIMKNGHFENAEAEQLGQLVTKALNVSRHPDQTNEPATPRKK